ncbi:MAG: hypothetical protein P1V19_03670 [Gimesia sp.]|nr:hypothetical protein [Gimesia sp.]
MHSPYRSLFACLLLVCFSTAISDCHATIIEFQILKIDFTNPKDAAAKAIWFPTDKLSITDKGLGFKGQNNSAYDGWIQTKPMAVGLSWRTPSTVSLKVTVDPAPAEITLPNGNKTIPHAGAVFARYSPDLKHWSSWQELPTPDPGLEPAQNITGNQFSGVIKIPKRESNPYRNLVSKYSSLDVPWNCDEEAAVNWILEQQPDFFAHNLPFIGYVEFLFEKKFNGNQSLRAFQAEVFYGLSGLHTAPRNKEKYKGRFSMRWRFKSKGIKETDKRPR